MTTVEQDLKDRIDDLEETIDLARELISTLSIGRIAEAALLLDAVRPRRENFVELNSSG